MNFLSILNISITSVFSIIKCSSSHSSINSTRVEVSNSSEENFTKHTKEVIEKEKENKNQTRNPEDKEENK
ncbi:hypothetical protein EHP00_1662 [Ecytonucleospora hepatopenaei]|uniref:Uncharacterized protein n=1 Tax=Ecytonucleospora hepatopenaei TaxID=646526 RepID=A0A1W0E2Z8_9MICR|nr:hypothetical protein EHP00_1662 [Ecytonucleospora hepatopenaei]